MVSLEQLSNLHVLGLNSGTLLKNVLFQMLILLQTTQQTTTNKQQTTSIKQTTTTKTNSYDVSPTQLLPLGLVSSSLSHFQTLFLTQSDPPELSSGCCATSLQPPCWGRGLGLPRLHHRGPPPEACPPEEERRTKMHQWHRIFNCASRSAKTHPHSQTTRSPQNEAVVYREH